MWTIFTKEIWAKLNELESESEEWKLFSVKGEDPSQQQPSQNIADQGRLQQTTTKPLWYPRCYKRLRCIFVVQFWSNYFMRHLIFLSAIWFWVCCHMIYRQNNPNNITTQFLLSAIHISFFTKMISLSLCLKPFLPFTPHYNFSSSSHIILEIFPLPLLSFHLPIPSPSAWAEANLWSTSLSTPICILDCDCDLIVFWVLSLFSLKLKR